MPAKRRVSQGTATLKSKTILRKACKILLILPLTSIYPLPYGTLGKKKPSKGQYEKLLFYNFVDNAQKEGERETGNTHPRAAPSRP